jgi:carbonic anhydrase
MLNHSPSVNGDEALQRLMEGNQRYVANKSTDLHEGASRRAQVAGGQDPFAIIFGCVDSRVPPELVFDCGLGDLFVIRTAGQVIDQAVLGSIEYGVLGLGIPLVMVLGHERCGAVKATLEALETQADAPGQIDWLVKRIRPALNKVKDKPGDLLDNAVRANIELSVRRLTRSPVLAQSGQEGQLHIVGACYDLDSGKVTLTVS